MSGNGRSANGRKASWTRLPDGAWGVKVEGPNANKFAGKTIPVFSRRRQTNQNVELGVLVQSWEANTKATYTPAPKKGEPPPMKPRGKVEVTQADLTKLITEGNVTIKGVTLLFVMTVAS